jgi:glycosidase
VFTRLFGNTNATNKPWGTKEENGVGKFKDFTPKALEEIRDLGVTHIWYTGVLHHAMVTDYSDFGMPGDDPDVVKGRAGSPYAIKDYYNVNPDLAENPVNRLEEFRNLVQRTHRAGMKVLIDIVPNHVARRYEGKSTPEDLRPFGADDNTELEYRRDNNFYYLPGQAFRVPEWQDGYLPLGGEMHPNSDAKFVENPAKWTGNGSRLAQPHQNDWYETVKVNYGVRPDGGYDFEVLPDEYRNKPYAEHFEFWKNKEVPSSWIKFKDIALYWIDFGVDGFRYDMAEMVPVEFWSYMNAHIKMKNPDAFLLAEVYNPSLYRDYIQKGKMDYLYDKVELYDSLKHIIKGYGWTDHIPVVQNGLSDIEHHMLHFLENHDEQRIASPEFAGNPELAKPAMVVSATLSTSPTLIYFGQEVGEPGAEDAGFGKPSRTSIFDYIGVPSHQRWMHNGAFDGGGLDEKERQLLDFYRRLLNVTIHTDGLTGAYRDIHYFNKENTPGYDHRVYSFLRWTDSDRLIIVSNFEANRSYNLELKLPEEIIASWQLSEGAYPLNELLYGGEAPVMQVSGNKAVIPIQLEPLQSLILRVPQ